eukprot:scaffold146908_cov14-Tisochrysis_lutea.AAC.1
MRLNLVEIWHGTVKQDVSCLLIEGSMAPMPKLLGSASACTYTNSLWACMGSPCNLNARGTEGDTLAALALVNPNDEVLLGSVRGKIMRLQASSVEVASPKNASRVLMDLHDGDSVQTIAVIPTANKANDSSSSGSSSD